MSWIDRYRAKGRLDGACLCGSVRIVLDGPHIAAVGVCHCGKCQRATGYAFGSFVAEAAGVAIEGEVIRFASTPFSERAFCPKCGSHIYLRNHDDPEIELFPGLFPGAADFPLISEIYTDRRPAYVPLAGDHRTKTQAEYEAANPHVEGETP